MPDPSSTLPPPRRPAHRPTHLQQIPGTLERGAADIAQLPLFEHLSAVMPAADLFFGGAMLVFIILVHAAGVRAVTSHVATRSAAIMQRPTLWRADLLMGSIVFMLLALHVTEMVIWSAALVYSNLVAGLAIRGILRGQHLYDRRLRQLHPAQRVADAGADHRDVGAVHVRLVRQRAR